jgi:hypothetical protein
MFCPHPLQADECLQVSFGSQEHGRGGSASRARLCPELRRARRLDLRATGGRQTPVPQQTRGRAIAHRRRESATAARRQRRPRASALRAQPKTDPAVHLQPRRKPCAARFFEASVAGSAPARTGQAVGAAQQRRVTSPTRPPRRVQLENRPPPRQLDRVRLFCRCPGSPRKTRVPLNPSRTAPNGDDQSTWLDPDPRTLRSRSGAARGSLPPFGQPKPTRGITEAASPPS